MNSIANGGGGERYSVLRADHRRRIQAIGAAISRRDWPAVEQSHAEIRDAFDRPDIYDPAAPTAKGGTTWRPMNTAPRDGKTQIVAKHKPNEHTPDGWIATITIDPDDGEYRWGGLDTIKHYNGDALMHGFHGVWTGWLYPQEVASPPPPAGAAASLDTWELAEERKRADLFVAKLNEAEGYATRLAQSLSDKHFLNPDWRPLPDLYGVLTQIDNMTTGLVRKVDPPAGAAGGGSGDLAELSVKATPGMARALMDTFKLRVGPEDSTFQNEFTTVAVCSTCDRAHANLIFLAGLWNAYRSGRLIEVPITNFADHVMAKLKASVPTPDLGAHGEPVARDDPKEPGYWKHQQADYLCQRDTESDEDWIDRLRRHFAPAAPRTGSGVSVEEIEKLCDRLDRLNTISEPQACADVMDEARLMILTLFAQAPGDGGETQGVGAPFATGARVRKTKGSSWQGRVCGFYSTDLTPYGVCVESEREPGSVQIYPASALEPTPPSGVETIRQDNTSGGK